MTEPTTPTLPSSTRPVRPEEELRQKRRAAAVVGAVAILAAAGLVYIVAPRRARPPGKIVVAVTPPVVGSASSEMNNPPASSSRASAALVLAICIRLSVLSCMRAPPEQLTISSGSFFSAAISMVRVMRSPTTLPIEPIMNVGSMTAIIIGRPLINPLPQTTASGLPLFSCSSFSRCE